MAFVQLVDGVESSESLAADLQEHVKGRLANYEYPRDIEYVGELPLTSTGKVRRKQLRERAGVNGDG